MATNLRNRTTGVLVTVDQETAQRLGVEWEPADGDKPKRAPAKAKAPAKTKEPEGDADGEKPADAQADAGAIATE